MSTAPASSLPSWLAWYLAQLAANPLRTKAITNSILAANQEAAAQKLSGSKSIDKRVFQMAAYGKYGMQCSGYTTMLHIHCVLLND